MKYEMKIDIRYSCRESIFLAEFAAFIEVQSIKLRIKTILNDYLWYNK